MNINNSGDGKIFKNIRAKIRNSSNSNQRNSQINNTITGSSISDINGFSLENRSMDLLYSGTSKNSFFKILLYNFYFRKRIYEFILSTQLSKK
jgi:hypothetical protein